MQKRIIKEYGRACFILFVLLAVAFFDVFFLGKTLKVTTANSQALPNGVYGQAHNKPKFIPVNGTDSPVLEEPIYEFIKNHLWKGILPLWNPHQALGYPLIGMIQVGIFFPLNIILYILPQIYSFDVLILLRIFLAGLFVYWLMRTLGFRKTSSLASGIAFMISGPMVLLQYWTVNVDMFVPILFVACEHLIKRTKVQNIGFLGLVICLTILGGHPEHIFLVNVYCVAFFSFRLFSLRKEAECRKAILYFIYSYLLGLGLSAMTLFPFLRNFLSEFWHGHPERVGLLMEETRERALSLALPHFFQREPLNYQWQFAGWWGGYLGTLPLGLAFISLFNKKTKGLNFFFAILAFLTIAKAYGLFFINWIGYLPLFDMCRYAIHTPAIAAFAVSISAGIGVETILSKSKCYNKGLVFSIILITIACLHLLLLKNSESIHISIQATVFAICVLMAFQTILYWKDNRIVKTRVIGILLLCAIFTELFLYIHRERPVRFNSFAKVPYIEILKTAKEKIRSYGNFWAFYPNTATGFGVDDLGYFFGLVPKRFVYFVNGIMLNNYFKDNLNPPALRSIPIQKKENILDLLNIRYIITPASDTYSKKFNHFEDVSKLHKLVYANEVKIYERANALPRLFIVHRAIFQPDRDKALLLIYQLGPQIRQIAVINQPMIPKIVFHLEKLPVVDRSTAKIVKYTPNEIIIKAFMENAGFLVLSEAYHPDWKVTLNGNQWKLFQTNYLMRSVFLPKGKHTLRFVFQPIFFYIGSIVTILSFLVFLALIFAHRLKTNKISQK